MRHEHQHHIVVSCDRIPPLLFIMNIIRTNISNRRWTTLACLSVVVLLLQGGGGGGGGGTTSVAALESTTTRRLIFDSIRGRIRNTVDGHNNNNSDESITSRTWNLNNDPSVQQGETQTTTYDAEEDEGSPSTTSKFYHGINPPWKKEELQSGTVRVRSRMNSGGSMKSKTEDKKKNSPKTSSVKSPKRNGTTNTKDNLKVHDHTEKLKSEKKNNMSDKKKRPRLIV